VGGAKRWSANGVGSGRGAIAPPQNGSPGAMIREIFEILVAKLRILMHFANVCIIPVSLKIFLFLASNNASQ